MQSYSVALLLYAIAVTFAGTELLCRFTNKHGNHTVMLIFAVLVPFILVSVGIYLQVTGGTQASNTQTKIVLPTTPTNFVPPSKNIWNSAWKTADGKKHLLLLQNFTLRSNGAIIANGTLNGFNVSGVYADGTKFTGFFDTGKLTSSFKSDDQKYNLYVNNPQGADWTDWAFTDTQLSAWYTFERVPILQYEQGQVTSDWGRLDGTAFYGSVKYTDGTEFMISGQFSENFDTFTSFMDGDTYFLE